MQQIDMSKGKPRGIAAKVPRVRYSAAYPTGRERCVWKIHQGNFHAMSNGVVFDPLNLVAERKVCK